MSHTDSRLQAGAPSAAVSSRDAAGVPVAPGAGLGAAATGGTSLESLRYRKLLEVFSLMVRSWEGTKAMVPEAILPKAFPTLLAKDSRGVLAEAFASYLKQVQALSEKEFEIICVEHDIPAKMYELERVLKRHQERETGSERLPPADVMPIDAIRPVVMEQKLAYAEQLLRSLEELNGQAAELESRISTKDATITKLRHSLTQKVEALKTAVKACEPFLDSTTVLENAGVAPSSSGGAASGASSNGSRA